MLKKLILISLLLFIFLNCSNQIIIDKKNRKINVITPTFKNLKTIEYKLYDESPNNITNGMIYYDNIEIIKKNRIFAITRYHAKYKTTLPHIVTEINIYNNNGNKIYSLNRESKIIFNNKYKYIIILETTYYSVFDYDKVIIIDENNNILINLKINDKKKYKEILYPIINYGFSQNQDFFYIVNNSYIHIINLKTKKSIIKEINIELNNSEDSVGLIDDKSVTIKNDIMIVKINIGKADKDYQEFKFYEIYYNINEDKINYKELK